MMSQKYNFSTIDNPISSKKGVFLTLQSKNKEAPLGSEAFCNTVGQHINVVFSRNNYIIRQDFTIFFRPTNPSGIHVSG